MVLIIDQWAEWPINAEMVRHYSEHRFHETFEINSVCMRFTTVYLYKPLQDCYGLIVPLPLLFKLRAFNFAS